MVGQSLSARFLAAVLLFAPLIAHAAGLGKLSVLSALGRPLNAEIEVLSVPRGDVESLSARVASNEAFRQAGIEFNPALLSIRMTVERRGDGAIIKLSSTQPISEPFLDVLIELQWASGRLVREYTFLLDPPGYTGPQVIAASPAARAGEAPSPAIELAAPAEGQAPAPAAVGGPAIVLSPAPTREAARAAEPSAGSPAVELAPAPAEAAVGQPSEPAAIPVAPEIKLEERPLKQEEPPAPAQMETKAPEAAPLQPAQEEATGEQTYKVEKGDTLSEIAQRHFVPGVTLNQMLIALYRENEDAFIRNNVNLVREGRILTIPRREAIAAVDPDEARQLVLSHMADFGRYRAAIAAAAAQRRGEVAAVEQTSGGRIETRAEQPAPAAPKDQVKLSKADPAKPSAAATRAAREDDTAARERELQEAQSRVADLEKNVLDLRKLLELKNQQLAELEKRAAGKAAEPPRAVPPAPVATTQPGQAPKPAATAPVQGAPSPAAPVQKAPEPIKPAPVPAPVAQAPGAAAKAPEPMKPAPEVAKAPEPAKPVEAPKPKPAAKPVAPPPPPPAPSFVDEFLENPVALSGLGAVFVILLGYGAWAWRQKKASQSKFQDSVLGPVSDAAGASSVFGPAQKAAAGPSSVVLPSVSQASVGGMETDEVDPIAEADVYMAYGRDAQAEEILREALEKDSRRTAIHEKLLEIYANRRDPKAFEQIALKLKEITGGTGPDWEKTVALGRSIDAQNTLYGGSGRMAAPVAAVPAASAGVDFDLDASPAPAGTPDLLLGTGGEEPTLGAGTVDIDLGATEPAFTPEGTLIVESGELQAASGGLDLDLGGGEEAKPASDGIDFELPATGPASDSLTATAPAASGGGLDFDLQLDLGDTKAEAAAGPSEASAGAGPLDLSSISLDLGGATEGEGAPASTDPKWQEVATKLDLAKAYEEMGDKNGASELLNEVLREGDGAQRSQAQELLAKLT